MITKVRSYLRRRREARGAKQLEEAERIAEAEPARVEHDREKLSARGAQPITPKHKW
jgi:hypothetical protein